MGSRRTNRTPPVPRHGYSSIAMRDRLSVSLVLDEISAARLSLSVTLENAGQAPLAVVGPLASDPIPPNVRLKTGLRTDALGRRPAYQKLLQWREGGVFHVGLLYREAEQRSFWTRLFPARPLALKFVVEREGPPASELVFHAQHTDAADFLKIFDDPKLVLSHAAGKKFKVTIAAVPRVMEMVETSSAIAL